MDELKFGSLDNAKAQALAAGFKRIQDNRYKDKATLNFTGITDLQAWPGLQGKIGGGYEYAFDGLTICARPTLPPNHGLNMQPKDGKETVQVMAGAAKILNDVGPGVQFLLFE